MHGPIVNLRGSCRILRHQGVRTFVDGALRFTVAHRGPGSVDFRYDSLTNQLDIERLRGTGRKTDLAIVRHDTAGAPAFWLGDVRLSRPLGAFATNCLLGIAELTGARGRFRLADGEYEFAVQLPCISNLRYDGIRRLLEVKPRDGSLALETEEELLVDPAAPELVLAARPSCAASAVHWQQIAGPSLPMRCQGETARLRTGRFPEGGQAHILVGASVPGALALETVIVRRPG
jgi:hypothetical protein